MTTAEWVTAYAAAAGISPPSQGDIDILLQLAGVAAPITCWIAATAGLDPAQALALAESMALDAS